MEWAQLIPWGISFLMLVVSLITLSRNGRKDIRSEYAEESGKIHEIEQSLIRICTKLDALQRTMDETRQDIKEMNAGILDLDKRVTAIEGEQKSMWIRIDEIREAIK